MAKLAPMATLAGWFNRARLGFPGHFFEGSGGIGDELLCTTVFRELRKRATRGIVVATPHPSLFRGNPDLDAVIHHPRPRLARWLRMGLPFVRLSYADYADDTDRDTPPQEHILAMLCRLVGLTGPVALRPYLILEPGELADGRLGENQVVIQSSGRAAAHFMRNKEWYPDRFQEVCDHLRATHTVIQIGSAGDPLLNGALDLRGQTSLRRSAAILANSTVFIGLVGFPMHLARAVDCRSVIVYGGRERPEQTGYVANINLIGDPPCSPCWLRNRCEYDHECMRMIAAPEVIQAAQEQMRRQGSPLLAETAVL